MLSGRRRPAARLVAAVAFALAVPGCLSGRSRSAVDAFLAARLDVPTERYHLPNGLEVILRRDATSPLVAVDLAYHAGAKDDPLGRAGLAHLVEHLMFDGSRHLPAGDHGARLADAGAMDVNGAVSEDTTRYFETVPAERLDLALWLEAERMAFGLDGVDGAAFEAERTRVQSEIREREEETAYGSVGALVRGALYPEGHPYHHVDLGIVAELDAVTLEDARRFHATFDVPNDATLVLVGDFDPAAARAAVAKYFGPIPGAKTPALRRGPLPTTLETERQLTIEAEVERAKVVLAWSVVPRFAPGAVEIEVGARALAANVRRLLVEDDRVADDVVCVLDEGELASTIEIVVDAVAGGSPDTILSALDERVHALRMDAGLLDRAEIGVIRTQLVASEVYASESLAARAALYNAYNHYAGTPDFASRLAERRAAVRADDVRDAFFDLLPFDRRVVAIVRPHVGAPRAGRLVGAL